MMATNLHTPTEICELKVITEALIHILKCAESSLNDRIKSIRKESRPENPKSPYYQAYLLDSPIGRFKRGIELIKQGKCRNDILKDMLTEMDHFHDHMNVEINQKLRTAVVTSDWCNEGINLINKFLISITEFRKKVENFRTECNKYF